MNISLKQWLRRKVHDWRIMRYRIGGRTPWREGYMEYRWRAIEESIHDQEVLSAFAAGRALPRGFGLGLDERVIEYPWMLSRLSEGPAKVLDAGSTLNFAEILDHPRIANKALHILTLAPETQCFYQRGISYLFGDLRDLPMRDELYDQIVCISTLEHVGMDNSEYERRAAQAPREEEGFLHALSQLHRVLRPGGKLLLSVPFGKYANHRTFQQFDESMIETLIGRWSPAAHQAWYYSYSSQGWQQCDPAACVELEYVRPEYWRSYDGVATNSTERAAAASAVACVELLK